jgi:pimeloyl-ACP methyl ester carboxylesterase
MLAFDALPDPTVDTDRWSGVFEGAGYRIEVPKQDWNGVLVMYAHGYAGTGEQLRVTTPSIRRYLLAHGYAWAASSYSTNYYDVRTGVEDTNKLALAFKRIAQDNGRTLDEPRKRYLIGHSMGGHITGAAIEKEAADTAVNKVHYDAALPMCGVLGDTQLFTYFGAFQFAAQKLADTKVTTVPSEFMGVVMKTQQALFSEYPAKTTPAGDELRNIVRNLTGGARPGFDQGFANKAGQDAVWSTFGGDGTISGILNRSALDTRDVVYQLDDESAQSDEERKFNEEVYRAKADADANPLRDDGLRWIPQVNGEIDIPVLSLHTLGDLYVPFKMEQIYHQRVTDKGNADHLVQRAIRGTAHCEFTYSEQAAAFEALVDWEENGKKPEGDDVLDANTLKDDKYGCKFTNNELTADDANAATLEPARKLFSACK